MTYCVDTPRLRFATDTQSCPGLTRKIPGHDVRPGGHGTFCNGQYNGKSQKVQICNPTHLGRRHGNDLILNLSLCESENRSFESWRNCRWRFSLFAPRSLMRAASGCRIKHKAATVASHAVDHLGNLDGIGDDGEDSEEEVA